MEEAWICRLCLSVSSASDKPCNPGPLSFLVAFRLCRTARQQVAMRIHVKGRNTGNRNNFGERRLPKGESSLKRGQERTAHQEKRWLKRKFCISASLYARREDGKIDRNMIKVFNSLKFIVLQIFRTLF